MRSLGRMFIGTQGLILLAGLAGCMGDPNDPRTWAKKLGNLRNQEEALDRIAQMDVERARVIVPELMALYQQTRSPEHLQALVRYQDPRTNAGLRRGAGVHRRGVRPGDHRGGGAGRDEGQGRRGQADRGGGKAASDQVAGEHRQAGGHAGAGQDWRPQGGPDPDQDCDHLRRRPGLPAEPAGGAGAGRAARSARDPRPDQGAVHDRTGHRHLPGVPPGAGAHGRAGDRSR